VAEETKDRLAIKVWAEEASNFHRTQYVECVEIDGARTEGKGFVCYKRPCFPEGWSEKRLTAVSTLYKRMSEVFCASRCLLNLVSCLYLEIERAAADKARYNSVGTEMAFRTFAQASQASIYLDVVGMGLAYNLGPEIAEDELYMRSYQTGLREIALLRERESRVVANKGGDIPEGQEEAAINRRMGEYSAMLNGERPEMLVPIWRGEDPVAGLARLGSAMAVVGDQARFTQGEYLEVAKKALMGKGVMLEGEKNHGCYLRCKEARKNIPGVIKDAEISARLAESIIAVGA